MQRTFRKTWGITLFTAAVICPLAVYGQEATPAGDLDTKLNAYVECFNGLDGSAHKTIERYTSWVKDMNSGPTGKEKVVYGLYQINDSAVTKCREQIAEAQGLKPSLALDGVAAEYMKAAESLNQVVEEMYPYYSQENYNDDKFAKAKQFHPRFVAQMSVFQAASTRFSEELDVENDKRLEAEMVQTEKEQGRKLPYLNMATMHKAKLLMRLLEKETFPVDDVIARLDTFEKAADEEIQFAKANPEGLPSTWSIFVGHIDDFRKAAKERMRRVRDKTPYQQGEAMMINSNAGWMVAGSQEKALKAYNELITESNSQN